MATSGYGIVDFAELLPGRFPFWREPRPNEVHQLVHDGSSVIQYHHTESFRQHSVPVTFLISEYVEGELLSRLIARQLGKRMVPFDALHLLYAIVSGLVEIYAHGAYHGDLHADNVLVRRTGIFYEISFVDFYYRGSASVRQPACASSGRM